MQITSCSRLSASSISRRSPSTPLQAPQQPVQTAVRTASTLTYALPDQQQLGRRELLASTLAAGMLLAFGQPALADIGEQAIDEYAELQSKGRLTQRALDDFRNKYKFKRSVDGRVYLKSSKGEWFSLRLDMEVPGAMLLRDPKGFIYAIQTETMSQVDLSDDHVILLLFAQGDWEQQMTPIEFMSDDGKVKQLKMEERDFRSVVGLLRVAEAQEPGQGQ